MSKNPFDIVRAINEKKPVEDSNQYNPFLSNMSFSYSLDTVMLANEKLSTEPATVSAV